MKNIKLSALLFLIFIATKTQACSWSSEDGSFYNLFDQQLISDKSLMPFFLTYDDTYFGGVSYNDNENNATEIEKETNYNILEWRKYFENQVSESNLNYLVYTSSSSELIKIINSKSLKNINDSLKQKVYLTDKGIEAMKYLIFAKKCEPFATPTVENTDDGWYFGDIRKKMTKSDFMSTAKDGNILYAETKNIDIKLRIAYQLVRLSHYGGFNDDAVRYFNTYVEPLKQKSLLYYYALEQKGGALFNQKKFAEAGCAYAQVFDNTTDRKIPCYTSFRISNQMNFDKSIALCKTPNEKAALYVLRGFNKFSNGLSEMKNIYAIAPNSSYLELMACRAMVQLEHTAFQIPNEYSNYSSFPLLDVKGKTYLQKVILFTETMLKEDKLKRNDFWQAYLAHLYLLNGDYSKSQQTANKINTTDKSVIAQKDRTEFCAYIGSLKTIDATAEEKIYTHFLKNKEESQRGFVYDILGHNYIIQKDYAKAFLCHNSIDGLYGNQNINIINDLIDFTEKKNKSAFEKELLADKVTLNALYELKGSYYFKKDDLENALVWYKKLSSDFSCLAPIDYTDSWNEARKNKQVSFNGYSNISSVIFSSNVQTYFESNVVDAFTDDNYKSFNFISKTMNKEQIVDALLQLKKLATNNDEQSAKANYLLGNFYYNTSLWGYYRNLFFYEGDNYYLSYIYNYKTTSDPIKKSYNYAGGTGIISANNPKKPYDYFIKAESISKNNELKANAVFQASKCELDLFYANNNDNYYGYDGDYKLLYSTKTRPMFKRLKDNYSQTAYYKDIVSNCNYFNYYLRFKL